MIKTYLLKIDKLEDPITKPDWIALLSPERKKKMMRCRQTQDRKQSAGAGLLLEYAFSQEGIRGGESFCFCNAQGKPCHEQIYFNVSHSGEWVLGVISDHPVGCDIQKKVILSDRLVQRICSSEEKKDLETVMDEEARQKKLHMLWALKESYVKMTGEGLRRELSTISFTFSDPIRICCDGIRREEKGRIFQKEDYVLALCGIELSDRIEEVNLTTVYKKLII